MTTAGADVDQASGAYRFGVAGLEVAVVTGRPEAGYYDLYPPSSGGGPPGLELSIERVPGFGRDRARGPEYPGFRSQRIGPETVALERFDAVGELVIPAGDGETAVAGTGPETAASAATGPAMRPVRGHFRVGDSPNSMEAVIRIAMSVALPRHGGLIVHASAVAADGQTSIFAGQSGAGKSTIASMLREHIPTLEAISDELLVLAPTGPDGAWQAHVTPFLGSSGLRYGQARPVRDIHFLVQASAHRRIRLDRGPALREFLRHVLVYVAEPATAARVLAAAADLMGVTDAYRLEFAKNPAVAGVLDIT